MELDIGIVGGIYGQAFNQAINIYYDVRSNTHFSLVTHGILHRIQSVLKAFLRQQLPKFNFGFLSPMAFIIFFRRKFELLISPQAFRAHVINADFSTGGMGIS